MAGRVDAVRATGGNNSSRTLIIQGPSTSIDRSVEVFPVSSLPKDVIENRLMFEVHYYDPYTYTLLNDIVNWGAEVNPQYYWGTSDLLASGEDVIHNCGYNPWGGGMGDPCTQSQMDESLGKMKTNYVDKGVPVIIGEFGANDRVGVLSGDNYARHRRGRLAYYEAFMNSARANQVVPIAWDTGHEGENNMTIIRRQSDPDGSVFDLDILNIMRKAYNLGDYVNLGIEHVENFKDTDIDKIFPQNGWNSKVAKVHLHRDGFMLYADGNIQLFDIKGNRICNAKGSLNLQSLNPGIYIAKNGKDFLMVPIR